MLSLNYWVSIVMGIVEGLTEFLPVSSTGHMILVQSLLGIPEEDTMMKIFEVVIQLGAIMAVVVLYWKRSLRLFGLKKSGTCRKEQSEPYPYFDRNFACRYYGAAA